jgi:hypothetical protein
VVRSQFRSHLLVILFPETQFSDDEIQKRFVKFYGDSWDFAEGLIPYWREKLSSLSEYVREIKVGFARYFNRRHRRRGYFGGDRFKSVLVDKGETVVNCLAYIDRNKIEFIYRKFRLKFFQVRRQGEVGQVRWYPIEYRGRQNHNHELAGCACQ